MPAITVHQSPLAGMKPGWRLACGWLTMFVVGTDLFIISPLLPSIGSEFHRSAGSAGLSVTVFSLAYLVSAPVLGQLADRIGRRRTLVACLFGFVVSNLLTSLSFGFISLLATRVAAGIAASGVSPLIYAGVGEAAPANRRATWMAIAVSGLLLSLSVGAPAGTLLASYWGWRSPFLILALLSLGLVVANRLVWPADPNLAGRASGNLPDVDPRALAIWLLPTVLWATALYGFYTYLGVWLTASALSPSQIARAIGFYGAGGLIGTLTGGRMADRLGTHGTMVASLAGLAACLTAFGAGVGTGWTATGMLLVTSIFAQFFFPAQQARLARHFPERRAFVLALNNSALFLGISVGSLLGGQAMALSGFSGDALTGALIATAALVFVVAGRKRQ
jgi:predicted MFS family arabinose efflux permease